MPRKQYGLRNNQDKAQKENNGALVVLIAAMLMLAVSNIIFYEMSINRAISSYESAESVTGKATSSDTAEARLCINAVPRINMSNCSTSIDENSRYECRASYEQNDDDAVAFSVNFITPTRLFNISPEGLINFTPAEGTIGFHTANITATDNSTCTNNVSWIFWEVEVLNMNDPPYLNKTIQDVDLKTGVLTHVFNLNDHFKDPDQDILTFTYLHSSSAIIITVYSSGSVWMESTTCDANDYAFFIATDPGNLSATSNRVNISVVCEDDQGENEGGGGGSGGGGGGMTCYPEWVCHDWGECQENGTRSRFCEDAAGCSDRIYWYYENCTYYPGQQCIPEWQCGTWRVCSINNTQARSCVDINYCDNETGRPETIRDCEYIPTCFDGVQNGNETGVDCGGECGPCEIVEQPKLLMLSQDNLWVIALAGLIGFFVIMAVVYKVFHKKIQEFLARLGWRLAGRYPRAVLIKKDDAEDLLKKLYAYEKKLRETGIHEIKKRSLELAALTRLFFEKALGLPYEMRESEVEKRLKSLEFRSKKIMSNILIRLFRTMNSFEFKRRGTIIEELHLIVEELIQLVYTTAEPGIIRYRESKKKTTEFKGFRKLLLEMANIEIALQYNEIAVAKKMFLNIIGEYDALNDEEKLVIYPQMQRINLEIRYMQGIVAEEEQD